MSIFSRNKKRYIVIRLVRQEGSYCYHSQFEIPFDTKANIEYKKKTYIIDITKPNLIKGNNVIYYVDSSNRQQVKYKQIEYDENYKEINADLLDKIVSNHVVSDIIGNIEGNKLKNQLWYILGGLLFGCLLGGCIGYIVGIS